MAAIVSATAVVALALVASPVTTALAISALFGVSVFVGMTYRPWMAAAWAAVLVVALGGGMLLGDVPHAGDMWIIFGATLAVIIVVLSRTSTQLRADAITDALTGLYNRFGLVEATNRAVANARRANQPLSVVHIDLNRFKQVNDLEGHSEGDRLLKMCAAIWRAESRAGDVLARIGGDEFVFVLPGSNRADAVKMLERLRSISPIDWCYGIAEFGPGDTLHSCLRRADEELYEAKQQIRPTMMASGRAQQADRDRTPGLALDLFFERISARA